MNPSFLTAVFASCMIMLTSCQRQSDGPVRGIPDVNPPLVIQQEQPVALPVGVLDIKARNVNHFALAPDNRYLVWHESKYVLTPLGPKPSRQEHDTRVWSIADNRQVCRLPIEEDVRALGFSPSGELLVTCIANNSVQLWDTKSWKRRAVFSIPDKKNDDAWGMTFSQDGKMLAVGYDDDDTVRLWDVAMGKTRLLGKLPYTPEHLSFSPDGRYLAAADFCYNVKVWIVAFGEEHWSFRAHVDPITQRTGIQGAAFHPDGRTLITAGTDGMVRLWDVPNKKAIRSFSGKVGEIDIMALSPDGKIVAVVGEMTRRNDKLGGLRLWDVDTGTEFVQHKLLDGAVVGVCFSNDGKGLVLVSRGKFSFWNLADLIKNEGR